MANAKVQEYLRGLQAEKSNLIKAAQDAIKELNEVGEVLGFSYSLTLDKGRKATSTGTATDDKATREKRITDLLTENPDGLFASEICEKLGANKTRVGNDLQALRTAGKIAQADAPEDRKQTGIRGKQPKLWVAA